MKVSDLLDSFAWDVGYAEVIVRENGCSKWLFGYRYGHQAFIGKYEKIQTDKVLEDSRNFQAFLVPAGKEYIVDKYIGIGSQCMMKIGNKKLPKKIADLEVCSWRCMRSLAPREKYDSQDHYAILINAYPQGYIREPDPKHDVSDGQMNITEWMIQEEEKV